MIKERYDSPIVEGHFRLDSIRDGKIIDTFEDHNLIVTSARKSMAEIFFKKVDAKYAHRIVLGTQGCKDGSIFIAKTANEGFVKERERIFSEVPATVYALGTMLENVLKGDILAIYNEEVQYWRADKDYKSVVLSLTNLMNEFTKLESQPYTYTINFDLPGQDSGMYDNCVTGAAGSNALNDIVRVQQLDTSVVFTFYVDTLNGNKQYTDKETYDSPTTLYNEAGLYVNDRLFSHKTFKSMVKDESVKFRIIWTITF